MAPKLEGLAARTPERTCKTETEGTTDDRVPVGPRVGVVDGKTERIALGENIGTKDCNVVGEDVGPNVSLKATQSETRDGGALGTLLGEFEGKSVGVSVRKRLGLLLGYSCKFELNQLAF